MLETGDVPILYSLPQMQNLGITLELAPKGAKITCPAFGLYSSPVDCTTMGHIVLDFTSAAYQPKSRERSARPRKHVTFALSQRKSAYPARVQKLDDDEDDKPSVQPTSVLKRESSAIRSDPTPLRRRKRPPVWRDSSATLEQDASGNSGLGKTDGEALQKITNKLLDVRNLKHPHLKHDHMSTAQFKKKTTHLDILGNVYDIYQHVVKTCPFCNSREPRADRSRVSGQRAKECGDLIFLDHSSTKNGDQTFGCLIVLHGATSHLAAYPCQRTSPSEVISKLHEWIDTFQMNPKAILRRKGLPSSS